MDKLCGAEIVTGRILRRERERRHAMKEKREKKEENMLSTEQVSYFVDTFTQKRDEIEGALNAADLGEVEKNKLPSHFDKISKDILILQRFTSDSIPYLREYDIRKSQEAIQNLQQKLQELDKRLLPKKKFGFKKKSCDTRKESFLQKIEDTVDSIPVSTLPFKALCGYTENNCGFSGRTEENLSLSDEVICRKDIVLTNLVGCTVKLVGSPSTLHMASLHNCRIMSGPVARSVFIEDCVDCTFILACQQLRIHNTKHCVMYSHVTSRTVIEDSTQLGFAPYSLKYENMEHHFKIAGLDININNWNLVDDFNWLASDKPSPNWHILKADEMKDDWV
ncbi:Tubulin-specific chaperone C [Cryptotermes secundus]|uniref:Tubulin-specific chaperone C n=1 Tax=Cryptotermes secundus TaxID=105785 RepID=A0A2J7PK76_9NEOP|nr:tubulin-specific chaperone C isoform X1 [Cryptotermes secundus]PNF16736.1 Tubulin-specific chaperone C [Cryptotermes secundus]PNF16737.1 Tubulin-specific chaperone C [Cryptotermes secundus]PNF16738.1 Tubulin-specific chaperone C [Cryptotermes secundus]PNF16739.1 Tubulin-specific chaperone C [Cryptotermes secundus]PNF16740.1 Tubulin-specific chaperone C [Cryptotermes secundus]